MLQADSAKLASASLIPMSPTTSPSSPARLGPRLAAAKKFARLGMKCASPSRGDRSSGEAELASIAPDGPPRHGQAVDVSRIEDVTELESAVRQRFAAPIADEQCRHPAGSQMSVAAKLAAHSFVNLGRDSRLAGVCTGHDRARTRRLIINTGSKQASPPAGRSRYNVSKAGVKRLPKRCSTNCAIRQAAGSARISYPGSSSPAYANGRSESGGGLDTRADRRFHDREVEAVISISLPHNDVTRQWRTDSLGGLRHRRQPPALSRWHPDYAEAFAAFVKGR